MNQFIIGSAVVLGALGLLFGIVLAVASRLFWRKNRQPGHRVRENLPGAQLRRLRIRGLQRFSPRAVVAAKRPSTAARSTR